MRLGRRLFWVFYLFQRVGPRLCQQLLLAWLKDALGRCAGGRWRRLLRLGGFLSLLEDEGVPPSSDYDFQRWLWRNHPRPWQQLQMTKESMAHPSPPLFSILLPVYRPDPAFLAAAIESVLAQAYPHWELCIWIDGPQTSSAHGLLNTYASVDKRITLGEGRVRGQISYASNQALAMAEGDYVALLDQDDIYPCLLYTSPSPRDRTRSRMPSSA